MSEPVDRLVAAADALLIAMASSRLTQAGDDLWHNLSEAIGAVRTERFRVHAVAPMVQCNHVEGCRLAQLDDFIAVHAILDHPDCKIIRNAADGYPEGREPRVLTLAERVQALLRMKQDYARWLKEKEDQLGAAQAVLRAVYSLIALVTTDPTRSEEWRAHARAIEVRVLEAMGRGRHG